MFARKLVAILNRVVGIALVLALALVVAPNAQAQTARIFWKTAGPLKWIGASVGSVNDLPLTRVINDNGFGWSPYPSVKDSAAVDLPTDIAWDLAMQTTGSGATWARIFLACTGDSLTTADSLGYVVEPYETWGGTTYVSFADYRDVTPGIGNVAISSRVGSGAGLGNGNTSPAVLIGYLTTNITTPSISSVNIPHKARLKFQNSAAGRFFGVHCWITYPSYTP